MHHIGPIAGLAAHGDFVATAGYDNRLILWDGASQTSSGPIALARVTHDHLVNACDFSHDGRLLVSASSDYTARIWSVPDLRLVAVLGGHGDDVDMARFSPDDRLIATCALDRLVRVYDRAGTLLHTMAGHSGNVLSLAWIDDNRFVTTSVDGTLREWDARDGRALRTTAIGMRTDCVAVHPDGRLIAGDDKGRIVVMTPGGAPTFTEAHRAGIKKLALCVTPGESAARLVTLGYDRRLAVWALIGDRAELLAHHDLPAEIWARAATMLPDGRIAVGTFGGTYALFDPASDNWDLSGVAAGDAINAIAERDGRILTIGDNGILGTDGLPGSGPRNLCNFLVANRAGTFTGGHMGELFDLDRGQVLHRHHSPLNCAVSYRCAGTDFLAVGTYTGEILVFMLGARTRLVESIPVHDNAIKSLVAADGLLMSVCANTDIAWHDLATLTEIRRVERAHSRIANAACALTDGVFASVGRDRMLRLWHPLLRGLGDTAIETPHPNSVKSIAASPCGRWIASGSYGGTVVVFDRQTGRFDPMQRISKAGIASLCWSPTRDSFLAADYAGTVFSFRAVNSIDLAALRAGGVTRLAA